MRLRAGLGAKSLNIFSDSLSITNSVVAGSVAAAALAPALEPLLGFSEGGIITSIMDSAKI